jgi:hypothetical protein
MSGSYSPLARLLQGRVRRLSLAHAEFIQRFVDFGMNSAKVRAIHIAALEEVDQVANELGAEIVFSNVALN